MATFIHWPIMNVPNLYDIPKKRVKKKKRLCLFGSKYKEQQEDLQKITQFAKVTHNQVHTKIIVNSVTWVMLQETPHSQS